MKLNDVFTVVSVSIFLAPILIYLIKFLICRIQPIRKKYRVVNKSGKIIEIDLRRKVDAEDMIEFMDVIREHK